jgi:hypothetical protein
LTSLRKWTGICAVLLFVATLVSGPAVAQDSKGDTKEQNAKMVEGTLMDIDQTARVLTLKTGDDEMQISYNEQTEMVVPETDGKPPVVHQGTKMRVHYMEREKAKMATKIEIIETTAAH